MDKEKKVIEAIGSPSRFLPDFLNICIASILEELCLRNNSNVCVSPLPQMLKILLK